MKRMERRRKSHGENEKEEKVAGREWEGTLEVKFKCRRTDRSSAQLRVRESTFLDTSKGLACDSDQRRLLSRSI